VVTIGDLDGIEPGKTIDVVKDDAFGGVYVITPDGRPVEYCKVVDIKNGKAKMLEVKASDHYTMGYLKARTIGDEMIAYMDTVDREVADYAGKLLMYRVKKKSRYYWDAMTDESRDEVIGVYHGLLDEGYEIKAADVLFSYVWRELVYVTLAVKIGPIYYKFFYKGKHKDEELGGCSAFGALNPDGSVIMGQTIDSPPQSKGFENYYFEEQEILGEGVTVTTSSYAGLFGWTMGWNSEGVCVVINNMFTSEYAKEPRLPYTFAGREALRVSSSAPEYINFWIENKSPNAQNYMVCDLEGNLMLIERSREEYVVWDVKKEGLSGTYWEEIGMLTSTNTFVADELKDLILFPDVCTGRQPTADMVAKKYMADGSLNKGEMIEILAYQPEGEIHDENAICYRPKALIEKKNSSITVHQLFFVIKNGKREIFFKRTYNCADKDYASPY
jgi:hypothetical protein